MQCSVWNEDGDNRRDNEDHWLFASQTLLTRYSANLAGQARPAVVSRYYRVDVHAMHP